MRGKTIVLGITGGIAAYKGAALCSKLAQEGADVHVIMTEAATKFIAPLTLQALSKNPVRTDTFEEYDPGVISHIDLADRADLVVIAPATADFLAKMANGHGDDMLSATLLAATAPVLAAPAMNVHMYTHPAVRRNMETLAERGVRFVEPGEGLLACGYVGKGRLAEPEEIVEAVRALLNTDRPLAGKKVLVTAGGTVERLDPVRYLTNDSSGKMGFALAEAARGMGAEVVLVCGKTDADIPKDVEVVRTESALDMLEAVMSRMDGMDVIIKAAAVADYRPKEKAVSKIKKKDDTITVTLVKNPDILQIIGERKTSQFVVGFAAETERLAEHAMDKLKRKNCDLIAANDVTAEGAGFGKATNAVSLFDANGLVEEWPVMAKGEVARRLLAIVAKRISAGEGEA